MATEDLSPTELDITAARGLTLDLTVNITNSSGGAADTSGYTPTGKLIGLFSGTETTLTLTSPTVSTLRIQLTATETNALDEVSKMLIDYVNGAEVVPTIHGTFTLDPNEN